MKVQNVNPFDFSKRIVRLTDNTMNRIVGGKKGETEPVGICGCSPTQVHDPQCDSTCVDGPNCDNTGA